MGKRNTKFQVRRGMGEDEVEKGWGDVLHVLGLDLENFNF